MDLRAYYKKLRETEASLPSPHVVLASLTTPDGGKPGVITEVPTAVAARMIIESSARVATDDERSAFREQNENAKQLADEIAAANKLQVVVVPAGSTGARTPRSGKEQ